MRSRSAITKTPRPLGGRPRTGLVRAAALAAALMLAPAARAQEATFPILFTEEVIEAIAADAAGERTGEIVDRIIGLSPSIRSVRLQRTGGRISFFLTAGDADGVPVSFQLSLGKMVYYRMGTARADVAGMTEALQEAKSAEPLMRAVRYRLEGRYSIVEVTLDMRQAHEEARQRQAQREAEARAAAKARAAEEDKAAVEAKAAAEAAKAARAAKAAAAAEAAKAAEEAKAAKQASAAAEAARAGAVKPGPGARKPGEAAPERTSPPPSKRASPSAPRGGATVLSARALGQEAPPVVDGKADDAAWQGAPPSSIEVQGASGDLTVAASARWSRNRLWVLLRWPDESRNDSHHPWVWSKDEGVYLVGGEVEDTVSLSFSREGRLGECMLAGTEAATDLWTWRAGRTDPSGFAEDATMRLSLQRLPRANSYQGKNGRTVWVRVEPDAGFPAYEARIAGTYEGDRLPRHGARTPSGSMADVTAKGSWSGGFWTEEFPGRLATDDPADAVFAPGKEMFFSVAVFDSREGVDHSVSRELALRLE